MTNSNERAVKVGDVVAWADVPDGALVREHDDIPEGRCFALRTPTGGRWVKVGGYKWRKWRAVWPWDGECESPVTIVALGLTGQESADDLRQLAEVFEVREALGEMALYLNGARTEFWAVAGSPVWLREGSRESIAERLHAAGWRPGMTAEDAARLLTEAAR